MPPVVIVHDQRSFDPAGHAERMKARRRERDRLQKARRYREDAAFRESKKAVERDRYHGDDELRERRKAAQRVESMAPATIELKRQAARARHWRERDERVAYARRYNNRPDTKAKRRALTLTKAILREVCDLLNGGPARQVEGRRRFFRCPRAALVVRGKTVVAVPSTMAADYLPASS